MTIYHLVSGLDLNMFDGGFRKPVLPNVVPESSLRDGLACQRHAALARWFESVPGKLLLEQEQRVVSRLIADRFGYHLVQVGGLASANLLAESRILNRCMVRLHDDEQGTQLSSMRGKATALPLESDSVDVLVLPHVLEFEAQAPQALREAVRVIVAEGHLIICGFNPWSLFGLWQSLRKNSGNAPWNGRFLAQSRLRDWFELLGLEVTSTDQFYYRPPLRNAQALERLSGIERAGHSLWPAFGGAYVLSQCVTMT